MSVLGTTLGNGILLAPMAGVTDPPMRVLARMFGAGPLFTEMLSAAGMVRGRKRELANQLVFLEEERPLHVQIVGSDPTLMACAAEMVQDSGADGVNINMACPARKVVGTGKGAALLRDLGKAEKVLRAVRAAVRISVTVKFRSGWDSSSIVAEDFARMARDCGVDMLIFHPRTREQGFSGRADWSLIAKVREAVDLPLVGNGDIRTADDAVRMVRTTGCDGVMIGRGAMGRPWLFSRILLSRPPFPRQSMMKCPVWPAASSFQAGSGTASTVGNNLLKHGLDFSLPLLEAGDPAEIARLVRLHASLTFRLYSEEIAARRMRKHLIWYSKGAPSAARFRGLMPKILDRASLEAAVSSFWA